MIRCLIVDDEPLARIVIQEYAKQCPDIEVVAMCKNAMEVMSFLEKEKVDVIFLDIQMPNISGLSLAKSLENPPLIVFTTAYDKYAIEGFEVNAVDYLLKPISFQRFNVAVEKVRNLLQLKNNAEDDYMFIRADSQDKKVKFSEILYIEGLKDYVKIIMPEHRIITLMNIKKILSKLPANQFVRVHKSYIVSLSKVESFNRNEVVVGGKTIPIGQTFKDDFRKQMGLPD